MTPESIPLAPAQEPDQVALNSCLKRIGCGLFLILIFGLTYIPSHYVPKGTLLIGIGLIMVCLNLARYLLHLPVSGCTLVLGIGALGISGFFDLTRPWFPILMILIGTLMLLKPFFDKKH